MTQEIETCRTCGENVAVYLGQCTACREKSTVDDDRRYVLGQDQSWIVGKKFWEKMNVDDLARNDD